MTNIFNNMVNKLITLRLENKISAGEMEGKIANLSARQALAISADSVKKILKKIGVENDVRLRSEFRVGNDWNSEFFSIYEFKGDIFLRFDFQYYNTDTTKTILFQDFVKPCDSGYSHTYYDRYGNPHTSYMNYDAEQKGECIKSLLYQFNDEIKFG